MSNVRVLITYASERGSTKEVAERIAERIQSKVASTKCIELSQVTDIEQYSALVIGSAIHGTKWLPEASSFLREKEETLKHAPIPVWTFSVGFPRALPKFMQQKWVRTEEKAIKKELEKSVAVRDHILFTGRYKIEDVGKLVSKVLGWCGGDFGDFRDWKTIEAWADEVGMEIARSAPSTVVRDRV
jgi:menaquinone-dependent protoporphyrinogen oxidase